MEKIQIKKETENKLMHYEQILASRMVQCTPKSAKQQARVIFLEHNE